MVVEEQFVTRFKIAAGYNIDSAFLFVRLTVRLARVVNPLCLVPADRRINHAAIVQSEEDSVVGFFRSTGGISFAFFHEIRFPVYSITRSPLRILRTAKTPLP